VASVVFVRHGESVWNTERRFQGNSDPALSPRGLVQAGLVARRLAERPHPAAIYTSPLSRAAITAGIIGETLGLPARPVRGLREIALGEWEGLSVVEIQTRWGETYQRWQRDPSSHVPHGGEDMTAFGARVTAAVEGIRAAHAGEEVVIISHAGAIGAYLCGALGLDVSQLFRFEIENASLTEVVVEGIGHRLTLLNDTSHLQDGARSGVRAAR